MSESARLDPDLLMQHAGFVRSLARSLLSDEALVEDVVQETLTRAVETGPRRHEALVAWLRTVTRNVAYKSYRSTARRRAREEDAARAERLPATSDLVARGEMLETLTASVMELPETSRQAVLLRYYEGLSYEQIGEQLGIGVGAARMRVHRAQNQLREHLDRRSEGNRDDWTASLAVLAGVKLRDAAASEEVVASASVLGTAGTVALVVAVGALGWFVAAPWLGARADDSLAVRRTAELAPIASGDALAGTDESDRRGERKAVPEVALTPVGAAASESDPDPSALAGSDVTGIVVDADGDPVAGARVLAAWGREPMTIRTRSDAEGRFGLDVPDTTLADAKRGHYPVLIGATADGHAPSRVVAWPVEFESQPDPSAVIRLRGQGGVLQGAVRGTDGGALAGARLEIGDRTRLGVSFLGRQFAANENPLAPHLACKIERGKRLMFKGNPDLRGTLGAPVVDAEGHRARLLPARIARTRSDGRFRVGGVEPGPQRLRITAPGHAPWIGTLPIERGETTKQDFVLAPESTVVGTVRRADGLPLSRALVHVLREDPWTARTVRMRPDGTFRVAGLRAGPARIVAEERAPSEHSPPRFVAVDVELVAGAETAVDLALAATRTRPVRFLVDRRGTIEPLVGQRLELRANNNPLLAVAVVVTDEEGRADLPIDTVVPALWLLCGTPASVPAGAANVRSINRPLPLLVVDPPPLERADDGAPLEAVLTVDEDEIRPRTVSLTLRNVDDERSARDVVLVPAHDVFTIKGTLGTGGAVGFVGVPPGRYSILAPYHALGWLSPFTVDVPAVPGNAEVGLGTVRLPELGELRLVSPTRDDGERWVDLSIQAFGAGAEVRVFEGRIAVPSSIPIAPGRYAVESARGAAPFRREVTVRSGQSVEVLWPVD